MSFLEILKELVDGVNGGIAACVIGTDGLSIQQYTVSGYDVETVAVEYGKVIDEIKNASSILSLGEVEEITVAGAGTDVLLRLVTPQYYIAFVIGGNTGLGRARYLLRRAALKTKKELAL